MSTLLAFSETGTFSINKDSISPSADRWLYEARENIQFLRSKNVKEGDSTFVNEPTENLNKKQQAKTLSVVEEITCFLPSNWSQGDGYNDLCPEMGCSATSNGRAYTGCVATAIAQVMYYHRFPASYDWDSMAANWGSVETARLMSDIGTTVGMNYGCDGLGTSGWNNTLGAFYFVGYTGSMQKKYIDGDADAYILKNEFLNNRPVLMSGGHQEGWWIFSRYTGGHEWVSDGYQKRQTTATVCFYKGRMGWVCEPRTVYPLFFHMNWGWGGQENDWFQLNNVRPAGNDFTYQTAVYYGIQP